MDVTIDMGGTPAAADGVAEAAAEAVASVSPSVPTTLKIEGVVRDAVRTTIGGHVIVHTRRLTIIEQKMLSRASDARDEGKAASMYNYAAACVRMLDEVGIGFPSTDAQINAILMRLGDDAGEYLVRYLQTSTVDVKEEAKN